MAALSAAVAVAGCGSSNHTTSRSSGRLVDISSALPLREQFNRDRGHARLLVLFSPT